MNTTERMQHKLAQLNFDFSQFTIEKFTQFVSKATGSEITFIGWEMPPGLFGAWVSIKNKPREYVFYDKNSPPILEIHTKLHELGHILNGHKTLQVTIEELSAMVKRNELSQLFHGSLLRGGDEGDEQQTDERLVMEMEAEMIAELVQTEVFSHSAMEHLTITHSNHEKAEEYLSQLGLK